MVQENVKPPIPRDEEGRLAALRQFQVLDTAPEQVFDDITLLASEICEAPIAMVSLVDAERQWFKSRRGLGCPETSRDIAFCAHGIVAEEFFQVEDALKDPRFATNPLVMSDPGIRFYAGAPLKTRSGHVVGMLCVNDYKPRTLSIHQRTSLEALARQIVALLELRIAEAKFRNIFDNTAEGIFQSTPEGRLITANRAFAGLFGYASPEEMTREAEDIARQFYRNPDRRTEFKRLLTEQGSVRSFESEFVRKDGTHIWVSMDARSVQDDHGEILYYEGTARDVTKLKKVERALREAQDYLEARVAERTQELQTVNRELSAEIQSRLQAQLELEATHKKWIASSREAGKAEMATGILHNVGNMITSINVSTNLVSDKIRDSKVATLERTVDLIEEHCAELGAFLTQDPKGKLIPAFLRSLAQNFAQERTALLEELCSLRASVEHIKEIVQLQQSYAKAGGRRELVDVAELVEDALRLNAGGNAYRHIRVTRDYAELAPANLDKHKVLQILVNLIRNSQHALEEGPLSDRQLLLQIEKQGPESFRILVKDNGVGIEPEHLEQIFTHGFTTKKNGHGFGLHSCRLAALELGGTLTAQSGGRGQGAAFVLELPCV